MLFKITHASETVFSEVARVAKVARLLFAYCETIRDLTTYVRNPPIPIKGPYFTCGGKLTSVKNIANREWLFEALYEGKSAVVKFVKTYGEDVHALLAANQLAPKLYEVKKTVWWDEGCCDGKSGWNSG